MKELLTIIYNLRDVFKKLEYNEHLLCEYASDNKHDKIMPLVNNIEADRMHLRGLEQNFNNKLSSLGMQNMDLSQIQLSISDPDITKALSSLKESILAFAKEKENSDRIINLRLMKLKDLTFTNSNKQIRFFNEIHV